MSDARQLQVLLERIVNLLRQELRRGGAGDGLLPVQLEALHYLAICNRFSDTPLGVTEYLGLTKGTVSQTLKVLEARGLLAKSVDADDRRVIHLALTAAGLAVLRARIPPPLLEAAARELSAAAREAAEQSLAGLLAALQRANQGRSFGVCRTCRFHRLISPVKARCELLGADLSRQDAGRICREHQAAA